jgi:hypothetical protein
MSQTWLTFNPWGETIYTVPFATFADAQRFTKFIALNTSRFSIIGLHSGKTSPWEVTYRPRRDYPWKGGVA